MIGWLWRVLTSCEPPTPAIAAHAALIDAWLRERRSQFWRDRMIG